MNTPPLAPGADVPRPCRSGGARRVRPAVGPRAGRAGGPVTSLWGALVDRRLPSWPRGTEYELSKVVNRDGVRP